MNYADLLYGFHDKAVQAGLCTLNSAYTGGMVVFQFYNGWGSIYTTDSPKQISDLIEFGRNHAIIKGAEYGVTRSAYGLLDLYARRADLIKHPFVVWDYSNYENNYISLGEWLAEKGFPVPEYKYEDHKKRNK